ncbi:MAG: sugar phosphate isomerase/epimerase [Deltaproteobacteria bacterium]|jgi:sugar phosphate isomerase/epimerase|nr:sugar phosphate isomerase/epimerase [Deltaproteobacteria bacterium]
MMYASLSLKAINPARENFRLLQKLGLRPEISFESGWTNYSVQEHKTMAAIIADHFPGAAVHLPYGGLDFGRGDNFLAQKEALAKAAEIASFYRPHHVVAHPSFRSLTDSVLGVKKYPGFTRDNLDGLSQIPAQNWLNRSKTVWSEVSRTLGCLLYLENTHEHSPLPLIHLLEILGDQAGFCLDFGHWFHYAMGRHWDNLDFWLERIGPFLAHVHVHDNNGEADQHLALGQGLIDYDKIRLELASRDLRPNMTIENYQAADLALSYETLTQRPLWSDPAKVFTCAS